MSSADSPYSAPNSDLSTATYGPEGIYELPRFSAWGVFFLSIVTVGFYYYYWLYRRTLIINRVCDHKISMILPHIILVYIVVSAIYAFYSGYSIAYSSYEPPLYQYLQPANYFCTFLSYIWLFAIRNRIHYMCILEKTNVFWIGRFFTVIGSNIYLQYKINQMIDHRTFSFNKEFVAL